MESLTVNFCLFGDRKVRGKTHLRTIFGQCFAILHLPRHYVRKRVWEEELWKKEREVVDEGPKKSLGLLCYYFDILVKRSPLNPCVILKDREGGEKSGG